MSYLGCTILATWTRLQPNTNWVKSLHWWEEYQYRKRKWQIQMQSNTNPRKPESTSYICTLQLSQDKYKYNWRQRNKYKCSQIKIQAQLESTSYLGYTIITRKTQIQLNAKKQIQMQSNTNPGPVREYKLAWMHNSRTASSHFRPCGSFVRTLCPPKHWIETIEMYLAV